MEGVMMRNQDLLTIAVRTPDGKIKLKKERHTSATKKYKINTIRIITNLFFNIKNGI